MIGIAHQARIFIYALPTYMRKSFDGLCGIVKIDFQKDILSGDYFVFFNRSLDRYKILLWDRDGLVLLYKRLEQGCFQRLPSTVSLSEYDVIDACFERREMITSTKTVPFNGRARDSDASIKRFHQKTKLSSWCECFFG